MNLFLKFKKNHFFVKLFFLLVVLWFITFIFIYSSYLANLGKVKHSEKGGTFIEGIFGPTSFLPYLRTDIQSKFYQSLLFDSCIKEKITKEGKIDFEDSMCHVTSPDYKTYYIALNSGFIRSDGVPLTLEDIMFTYQDILVGNKRELKKLNKYKNIKISYTDDGRIKVVFPTATIDNNLFFTNFILPKHVLKSYNLTQYQREFSIEPVYTRCSSIVAQTVDPYSLIFNLQNCDDTKLGFYQIKNLISFKSFKDSAKISKPIVDIYEGYYPISGYKKLLVDSREFLILFFNTQSDNLHVRTRRSLGGFIANKLKDKTFSMIKKHKEDLFSTFLSKGENLKNFLSRDISVEGLSLMDLKDSGISAVPKKIKLTGENLKLVYFFTGTNTQLQFLFKNKFKKVSVRDNGGTEYFLKSYSTKTNSAKYKIGISYGNLKNGWNTYEVLGYTSKGKKLIATINIYHTFKNSNSNKGEGNIIKIIFYDTPASEEFIAWLQKEFENEGILQYFQFEKKDFDSFFSTIDKGDYDIAIGIVDMKFHQDFSSIFDTDNKKINISQYKNSMFNHYLKNYFSALSRDKKRIEVQLNNIYSKDMPFLIIGNIKKTLNVSEKIYPKINSIKNLYFENRRDKIYKNLVLIQTSQLNLDDIFNIKKFREYIFSQIN